MSVHLLKDTIEQCHIDIADATSENSYTDISNLLSILKEYGFLNDAGLQFEADFQDWHSILTAQPTGESNGKN